MLPGVDGEGLNLVLEEPPQLQTEPQNRGFTEGGAHH